MLIEEVKKLSPLEIFMYWIRERHNIYLRKKAGVKPPWTDDEVLQTTFFTNPYRENDKVTVWFRENIRDPLRNDPRVLMATVIFRWFNLPETANTLTDLRDWDDKHNLITNWNHDLALSRLKTKRDRKQQIFTGAYMINSPGGEPKLEAICRRIDNVWKSVMVSSPVGRGLNWFEFWANKHPKMETAHEMLMKHDGLGGFMAYEIVCDLRYTYLLENASDKMTWSNPGPGAIRGLYRILGRDFPKGNNSTSPPVPKDWGVETAKLLKEVQRRFPKMPTFEMREIEHSLCECDKMMRILNGDGRAKRKYNGNG